MSYEGTGHMSYERNLDGSSASSVKGVGADTPTRRENTNSLKELQAAERAGLTVIGRPLIRAAYAALLKKN